MAALSRFFYTFPWGKALILWALVIFWFSAHPGSPVPRELTMGYLFERKGAHIFEYFILTLLLLGFLAKRLPQERFSHIALLSLFVAALYALTDEFHQYFVPYRHAQLLDVGIDVVGAILAIVTAYFFLAHWKERKGKEIYK